MAPRVRQPPIAAALVSECSHLGQPRAGAHGRPASAPTSPLEDEVWSGGATLCDAQADVPHSLVASGATCVQRLDGSRDSAIHTKYRISLRSSSMREPRYPLPRVVLTYRIRRSAPDAHHLWAAGAMLDSFEFLGAVCAGVSFVRRGRRRQRASASEARVACPPAGGFGLAPRPPVVFYGFTGRSAVQGFNNDPSAGSPTETLLRLLLPLNDKVQWTSCDVAGSEPPTSTQSEHFTDHSIGRSDGRCVQRAGRSQRELMTRAY
ncbi:hypothetical protein FNV43_RR20603 [Rhamnella rubrinervis]|uniref:Uncharacterized protein n=1 Tax=Rhamnella rubrinervis TaxID=2594499 RepID=A0A8K0GQM2_9ROSA|nr:hypothetical protein FNV43_RR20603 [Rhamnella rubrinervis]